MKKNKANRYELHRVTWPITYHESHVINMNSCELWLHVLFQFYCLKQLQVKKRNVDKRTYSYLQIVGPRTHRWIPKTNRNVKTSGIDEVWASQRFSLKGKRSLGRFRSPKKLKLRKFSTSRTRWPQCRHRKLHRYHETPGCSLSGLSRLAKRFLLFSWAQMLKNHLQK